MNTVEHTDQHTNPGTDLDATHTTHPAFTQVRQATIEALNLRVEQYEHRATGAQYFHLAADNPENVFLVALRTVPHDSTGVAHILEHTALCGSERFPVRDPFFMMLRRSLNTFMNAFTSSDWTAYPFASQNRKDFNNLLDVYLDAVFFSRLDPLDFAQEGHRVEFEDPNDPNSELLFKGVVFNEMKGAMSAITSTLWSSLCEHLFPTSTYHYNSGGDPEHIPDLSYSQLKAFYESHYHPSNAIFMTFGNISAAEHQAQFEDKALRHFQRLDQRIQVEPEQRLTAPLRINSSYAYDESDDTSARTHLVMGWMLGESTDLQSLLEAQLLASVLLDNSASPLQQALETTELGRAPSPLCGLEDSMRELVFCCGIEGSEAEHADSLEGLVLEVVQRIANEGVEEATLESVLHQLELHQREISGDSYPYGLQLILQALGCATHYADPIAVLDLDPVIATLRERIRDPHFIRQLAQKLLLDNPHRVTLVMTPDTQLSAERQAKERERLRALQHAMDATERDNVIQLAQALQERQAQDDDPNILPKVELSDVPAALPQLPFQETALGGLQITTYQPGTNGLVYQQVVATLPQLDTQALELLPLYSHILTEVGNAGDTYLATQQRQAATVGGISAFATLRSHTDDEQCVHAHFTLSAKALARNHKEQTQLLRDTLAASRFDEHQRLRELISAQLARREQGVTGNGHVLAMTAASAGMSGLAQLSHRQSGLEGIRTLRALNDALADDTAMRAFAERLVQLHETIQAAPVQFLAVGEEDVLASVLSHTAALWAPDSTMAPAAKFSLPRLREPRAELWLANTQVNFCAKAYPTVAADHPDAPALTVLGGVLRNGFLHRAIREQGGAYGGGASQDSSIATFRFYSYRDPRLTETLADFDAAVDWLLHTQHEARVLEEAILGVVASIDKPGSPAGEAKQDFHNRLTGRTHEQRQQFRSRILDVSLADLTRVTAQYLQPENASTAVITQAGDDSSTTELGDELGLNIQEL